MDYLTELATELDFEELATGLKATPGLARDQKALLLDEVMAGECPEDLHLPAKEEVLQLLRVPVGVEFLIENFCGGDYESIAMPSVDWCEGCLQFAMKMLEK